MKVCSSCGEPYHSPDDQVVHQFRCRRCGGTVLLVSRSASESLDDRQSGASPVPSSSGYPSRRRSIDARVATIVLALVAVVAYGLGARSQLMKPIASFEAPPEAGPVARSPSSSATHPATPTSSEQSVDPEVAPLRSPDQAAGRTQSPSGLDPVAAYLHRYGPPPTPGSSPACEPDGAVPASSTELTRGVRDGRGVLAVDNGTGADAVVVIVGPMGRVFRRFFVRAGSVGEAHAVPIGAYYVRFVFGSGYSRASGRFCTISGAEEFNEPFTFEENRTSDSVEYVVQRITLHKVSNGNAPSHSIAPDLVFSDAHRSSPSN